MDLSVTRDQFTTLSTGGRMTVTGDSFSCYTLEPVWREDGAITGVKPRAIPFGTFPLTIRWSVDHARHLPHVENVPGFTAVEIHIGNYSRDTLACTLVGETRAQDYVGRSLVAFVQLFNLLLAAAELTNPGEQDERLHVWDVGKISYIDGRTGG